jgi:molecular chaperone DnaK
MQEDAEAHADEDKKKMELIETKNLADQMVHTAEKALKDAGDKVGDDVKKEVNEVIEEVKKARAGEDGEAIKTASTKLSDTMMKIGEAMKTANDNAAKEAPSDAPASETGTTEEKKDEPQA